MNTQEFAISICASELSVIPSSFSKSMCFNCGVLFGGTCSKYWRTSRNNVSMSSRGACCCSFAWPSSFLTLKMITKKKKENKENKENKTTKNKTKATKGNTFHLFRFSYSLVGTVALEPSLQFSWYARDCLRRSAHSKLRTITTPWQSQIVDALDCSNRIQLASEDV